MSRRARSMSTSEGSRLSAGARCIAPVRPPVCSMSGRQITGLTKFLCEGRFWRKGHARTLRLTCTLRGIFLPFWRAAFSEVKSLEVARYLLENGANPSSQVNAWLRSHPSTPPLPSARRILGPGVAALLTGASGHTHCAGRGRVDGAALCRNKRPRGTCRAPSAVAC